MELRHYLSLAWKWAWLIVLAVAIAATSSYFASKAATPLYRAQTTLMVGRITQDPNPTGLSLYASQQLANAYVQFATREPVLKGVIESLGLDMDWKALVGQISASAIPQTQFIQVNVVDTDPYRAKVLADAVAQQLILLSPANPNKMDPERAGFIQNQLTDLEEKIKQSEDERKRLQSELAGASSARQIQDLQNRLNILDTKISDWQSTYASTLLSLQGGEVNTLSIIEEAYTPTAPFSPNVMNNVMVAAAIGFVLAIAGIFLIEYLDDTIKTLDDVMRVVNLPTVGAIPHIAGNNYPEKVVAIHQPMSPVVEGFRLLRTNLRFSTLDRPLRTMLVTSPGPSEGKSIIVANLAVVMAQAGLRVILVDADMRRPTIHKLFGLSNKRGGKNGVSEAILHVASSPLKPAQGNPGDGDAQPAAPLRTATRPDSFGLAPLMHSEGVSTLAAPGLDLTDYLQKTPEENLFVLTTGSLPPNPAEMLGSEMMSLLIEQLKGYADLILFDTPPCLVVADAAVLSTRVDGVLLINDVGSTRTNETRRAIEELHRARANVLGVVLNHQSKRIGGYNNYYYYYYYYYYTEDGERRRRRGSKLPFGAGLFRRSGNHRSQPTDGGAEN